MKTIDFHFHFHVPERLIPLSPPELRGERRDHACVFAPHRSQKRVERLRREDYFQARKFFLYILLSRNPEQRCDELRPPSCITAC